MQGRCSRELLARSCRAARHVPWIAAVRGCRSVAAIQESSRILMGTKVASSVHPSIGMSHNLPLDVILHSDVKASYGNGDPRQSSQQGRSRNVGRSTPRANLEASLGGDRPNLLRFIVVSVVAS